jgi:hypothetical protein
MKSSISESGEDSWADDTHHIFVTTTRDHVPLGRHQARRGLEAAEGEDVVLFGSTIPMSESIERRQ